MFPRLMYRYYHMDSGTLTASSTASGFAVANIQDPYLNKQWKSDAGTSHWLKWNLSGGLAPATRSHLTEIAIFNHNFADLANLTVKVQANSSDSWGSPPFEQSFTSSDTAYPAVAFFDQTYYWWRILIECDSAAVEIGRVCGGQYIELPVLSPTEWQQGFDIYGSIERIDPSIERIIESGQAYYRVLDKYRRFALRLNNVNLRKALDRTEEREKNLFATFFGRGNGVWPRASALGKIRAFPLTIDPNDSPPGKSTYYVRRANPLTGAYKSDSIGDTELIVEEYA